MALKSLLEAVLDTSGLSWVLARPWNQARSDLCSEHGKASLGNVNQTQILVKEQFPIPGVFPDGIQGSAFTLQDRPHPSGGWRGKGHSPGHGIDCKATL